MSEPLPIEEIYPFWRQGLPDTQCYRLGICESFFEKNPSPPLQAELAPAGTRLRQGDSFGFLHTAEGATDLRAPCAMEILTPNPALAGHASLVREAGYGRGWLIEFKTIEL